MIARGIGYAVVACALGLGAAHAAEAAPEHAEAAPVEMTSYQLVLLTEPEHPVATGEAEDRRTARIVNVQGNYLAQLIRDDAAVIAGDLVNGDGIHSVAVLQVDSTEQAEEIFSRSPSVETGRLKADVYLWSAPKNVLRKPADPHDVVGCYLGLLERPPHPPRLSAEELERIQEGHLANIRKMADAGALVIAGPVENGDDLRGILIFRDLNVQRIRDLVAEDPAVQAGRLQLKLYRWMVPRGSFPES